MGFYFSQRGTVAQKAPKETKQHNTYMRESGCHMFWPHHGSMCHVWELQYVFGTCVHGMSHRAACFKSPKSNQEWTWRNRESYSFVTTNSLWSISTVNISAHPQCLYPSNTSHNTQRGLQRWWETQKTLDIQKPDHL